MPRGRKSTNPPKLRLYVVREGDSERYVKGASPTAVAKYLVEQQNVSIKAATYEEMVSVIDRKIEPEVAQSDAEETAESAA